MINTTKTTRGRCPNTPKIPTLSKPAVNFKPLLPQHPNTTYPQQKPQFPLIPSRSYQISRLPSKRSATSTSLKCKPYQWFIQPNEPLKNIITNKIPAKNPFIITTYRNYNRVSTKTMPVICPSVRWKISIYREEILSIRRVILVMMNFSTPATGMKMYVIGSRHKKVIRLLRGFLKQKSFRPWKRNSPWRSNIFINLLKALNPISCNKAGKNPILCTIQASIMNSSLMTKMMITNKYLAKRWRKYHWIT